MGNELYINQVLDDYLYGKTTRAEAEQLLEKEAVTDISKVIELHEAAAAALQRYNVIVQVKNVHAQFVPVAGSESSETMHKSSGRAIRMKSFKWFVRIAAILILVAGGLFVYQYSTNSSSKLYAEIYQPYNVNTDRTGINEIVPHNMIQQFKDKDYSAVIKTFQSLPVTNNREKFLAANAFHETGDYQRSIDLLNQILLYNEQHGSRLYKDEAEFYLGLAYLKMKNEKAALPWFQKIYDAPNHTFHERVSRWTITRLKWLK